MVCPDLYPVFGKKAKLIEELESFNSERDRIRHLIGEIGGNRFNAAGNDSVPPSDTSE